VAPRRPTPRKPSRKKTPPLVFEVAVREQRGEPVTFVLLDETFTCVEDPGAMPLLELAAASELDTDSVEGLAATYEFIRCVISDEDWPRFRKLCMRSRVGVPTLMKVVTGLVAAIAGRPTTPPSTSGELPSPTGTSSTDDEPELDSAGSKT
jgi:hypothetical protein